LIYHAFYRLHAPVDDALFRSAADVRETDMRETDERQRRRGAVAISELIGKVIDPVTKRRGFATTDIIAAWREIVGPRFAEWTRPEKIVWPKGEEMEGAPALLVLRVDGPRAVLVQHEAGQIVERVNAFLGYGAIGNVRIIQAPVRTAGKADSPAPRLTPEDESRIAASVSEVEHEGLRTALGRLGRGVMGDRRRSQ
jgi:hypothetical protein